MQQGARLLEFCGIVRRGATCGGGAGSVSAKLAIIVRGGGDLRFAYLGLRRSALERRGVWEMERAVALAAVGTAWERQRLATSKRVCWW